MKKKQKMATISIPILILIILLVMIRFLGSGSEPPDKEGEEVKVENPDRMVSISVLAELEDYETFGSNEYATVSFNRIVFVGNAQPQVLEQVPPPLVSVGDEIRVELDITITRINAAGDISISVEGRLYEGISSNTSDLDGTNSTQFQVPADTTMSKSFAIWNTSEDEPEDRADITLTVYNSPAP